MESGVGDGKEKRRVFWRFLCAAVLLGAAAFWGQSFYTAPNVLRVGIFAGSNWNVPASDSYAIIDDAIKRFEARHAGVTVEYVSGIKKEDYSEWLAEQILKGEEPDVFMVLADDFNLYASMGLLADLGSLMERDESFDPAAYYSAALSYGQYENVQYALPFESVPTLMFVNKTLLEREQIAVPGNDWTWEEFLRICKKVVKDTDSDGIVDQFGCYDYTWQQAAITNGAELFKRDGSISYFADKKMEETIRFLMELQAIHHGYQVTARDFDMGRVAFRPFNFAEYRTYKPYPWRIKKYTAFEWDCIKLPAGPSGANRSELDTLLIGLSSRSDRQRLAWEFLKQLCYDVETQKSLLRDSQGLPVLREAVESEEARRLLEYDAPGNEAMNLSTLSEVLEEAAVPPKFKKYENVMLQADHEIRKIILQEVPFNNALNKLQKEINAYLQY